MINSACRGSASYSIRSRPDPYGGLTLFSILTSVTSPSAVHGPNVARCLTMRMLGQLFLELLLLCPRARHHKDVTVCEHRHGKCARMVQTKRKLARIVSRRCQGIFTRNIKAQCSVSRSVHGFVQNCVTTRTLVIFSWHLDHDRTKCGAVEMCSTDVVEYKNFLFSKCPPLASHASTEHDLGAFQCGGGREGREGGCKRAARAFRCQFAHNNGFLCNQPRSDHWIHGVTLVRVDPSCSDGFEPRLVQIACRNSMVNSLFTHERQLFLDGVSHQLGVKWQSSDFIVLNLSRLTCASFCTGHSSSTVGPASALSMAPATSSSVGRRAPNVNSKVRNALVL